jgi:hypothetical protein
MQRAIERSPYLCSYSFPTLQGGRDLPPLARLAFLNAGERFKQSRFEPCPQDLDQHCLLDRFGLNRLVWPSVLVAAVALDNLRKIILLDLRYRQRNPLPTQPAADLAFKNALGVGLDLPAKS